MAKAELARRLGVTPGTVSEWRDDPPAYALAYLKLAMELKAVSDGAASALKPSR